MKPQARDFSKKCMIAVEEAYIDAVETNPAVFFVSVVGSQNYGVATETSDVDMKAVVFPGFANYWNNSLPNKTKQVPNSEHEYQLIGVKDWYVNGLLKANINFFEPLYSKFIMTPDVKTDAILSKMRTLLEGNVCGVIQAQFWTAHRHMKDFLENIERENQVHERSKFGYNSKSAANAFRLLKFCESFYESGNVNLDYCAGTSFQIRMGHKDKEEIEKMLTSEFSRLGNKFFDNFDSKSKTLPSKLIRDLDKTGSNEWKILKEEINILLMKKNLEVIKDI